MINLVDILKGNADSLYLHIPFCESICSYCDFCKYVNQQNKMDRYIDKVISDLKLVSNKNLKTFYIGGGTPTSLDVLSLEKLLSFIDENFKINEEFTIEANPESCTLEKIKLLNKYNVNRVSLGVQSFNINSLKYLNRKHDYNLVKNVVTNLQENGISNINLDFIYGIKGETLDDIKNNIDLASNLNVTHISYYGLQIEKGTKLYHDKNSKISDDELANQYEFINKYLKSYGYKRYEISNFSKDGYNSIHNKTYWRNNNYYGIGLNASGFIYPYRYSITDRLLDYINEKKSISSLIFENKKDKEFNYLMLNLRLVEGFNLDEFKQLFNKDFVESYKNKLMKLDKFICIKNNKCYIKPKYLYIMDSILVELLNF